jgi:hypothetical protein
MRPPKKRIQKLHLLQDFHRRWVDRVASKVVQEVVVLFDDAHPTPCASEEQPGHHSGGTAPED